MSVPPSGVSIPSSSSPPSPSSPPSSDTGTGPVNILLSAAIASFASLTSSKKNFLFLIQVFIALLMLG